MPGQEQTTTSAASDLAEIANLAKQSSSANEDKKWRSTYATVMVELSYKTANRRERLEKLSDQEKRIVGLESEMAKLALGIDGYFVHQEHSQAMVGINVNLTTIEESRNQSLKKTSAEVFLPKYNELKKTEAEITDGIRTLKQDLNSIIKTKDSLIKEVKEMIERNEAPALIEAKLKQAEKQITAPAMLFKQLKDKTKNSLQPELDKLILDLRTALDAASMPYTPIERPSAPSIS